MAKPVVLSNGRRWKSKKEALDHFRKIIAQYVDGDVIDDAGDHSDLSALLERYDSTLTKNEPKKCGAGIKYFSRELNIGEGWSSSGFHVHRTDGTSEDFSFIRAVNTDP